MTPQERVTKAGLILLRNCLDGGFNPSSLVREQIEALLRPLAQLGQSLGEVTRPIIEELLGGGGTMIRDRKNPTGDILSAVSLPTMRILL